MSARPAIRHLFGLVVLLAVLVSGSSVLAAESADPPSGVIAVTVSGDEHSGVEVLPSFSP
jgi:hypothetical protein